MFIKNFEKSVHLCVYLLDLSPCSSSVHSVMPVNKQLCWPGRAPQFLPALGGVNSLKYLQLPGMPLQHSACVCVCVGGGGCEGMMRQRPCGPQADEWGRDRRG